METLIPWFQIILSIVLIGAILLQQRSSSLGGSFGGDSSAFSSRRGIEKTLFIITIIVGILYFLSALLPIIFRS